MPPDQQVCCIYLYDNNGFPVKGGNACVPILKAGENDVNKISAADCTKNKTITLPNGNTINVPYGRVAECCSDCEDSDSLLIVQKGKLVKVGSGLSRSPPQDPDKCCCGDKPCCKKVKGCQQVRCYPEPEDCDRCAGKCTTFAYDENGEEIIEDRDVNCATITQCCLDDNSGCIAHCKNGEEGEEPKHTIPQAWEAISCTKCGICCRNGRAWKEDANGDPITKETCEAAEGNGAGVGGVWHENTDNENVCNPVCCYEAELGDETRAVCRHGDKTTCDPCIGVCTDLSFSRPPKDQEVNHKCPQSRCKTKQDCCGEGNEKCINILCPEGAKFLWEETNCGSNPDECGICCVTTYNEDETKETGQECDKETKTREDCEKLKTPLGKSKGAWFPFETCAVCDGVNCCREVECEESKQVVCVKVSKDKCEDKCRGFCVKNADNTKRCATKADCCGEDGTKCVGDPCQEGNTAEFSWSPACADAEKCGVCCIITLKEDGTGVKNTECQSDTTKTECEAQDNGDNIVASWRAFETCESTKCATKQCCGIICEETGKIGCKTVDFEDDCDECKGRCVELETEEESCATKTSCCGDDGQKCNGPEDCKTHSWSPICTNIGDENEKCGVCCELTYEDGKIVDSSCQEITYKECAEINEEPNKAGIWHQYETCDSVICRAKKCCKETSCGKSQCIDVDYDEECDECKGLCTEYDEDGNETDVKCKTKDDCCGANGKKCEPCNPGEHAKFSWDSSCADAKKCGVCCGVTTDTNGKTIKVECKELDQDQCANEAGNINANVFWTWKPFTNCENARCATKKCCDIDECTGKNACIDVDFNEDCDECAGLCTAYDAQGNPGEITCKTKAECCGNNNYDCEECTKTDGTKIPKKAGWTGPCGSGEKCGVCCKVTTDGAKTVSAECVQKTQKECQAAGQQPNVTFKWVDNATCESAKCATKTCCDKNCANEDACVEVDFNKECDPCKGLCTDIASGEKTCKTKQSCCGGDGKACEDQTDCGGGAATKSWSSACADANECGVCCKIVLDDDGEIKSADCQQIAKDACLALDNGDDIVASWRQFETCDSVKCATKTCCGPKCPGSTVFTCIQIDFNQTCDPCSSICTEIATGNTSCKTKQDCCGADGKKCGACESVATHTWSGVCGDGSKCGVCCTLNYEDGELKSTSCAKGTNKSCTDAANPPDTVTAWHEFETCGSIKCATKKCCGEDCAKKVGCVDIDFNKECDPCKGICTDIETNKKSCSSKESCCGSDGGKCGAVCGQDQTHSWAPDCADGSKCGVCCVVEYSDGKVVSANCINGTQANCTAQNAPPFFVATWHPFETCDTVKCATKKCCQDSQCLGVTCADIDFNDDCNYCHGICTDTENHKYCETKQNCCGNDGNNCGAGKNSWSSQCADGTKCGACCQITYDNSGNIINAECIGTDYVECMTEIENDTATRHTSWQAFETCDSINCGNKPCCKTIDDTTAVCGLVPFNQKCDRCAGVCVDIETGDSTCAKYESCCGLGGVNCNGLFATKTWSPCVVVDPNELCCNSCCRTGCNRCSINFTLGVDNTDPTNRGYGCSNFQMGLEDQLDGCTVAFKEPFPLNGGWGLPVPPRPDCIYTWVLDYKGEFGPFGDGGSCGCTQFRVSLWEWDCTNEELNNVTDKYIDSVDCGDGNLLNGGYIEFQKFCGGSDGHGNNAPNCTPDVCDAGWPAAPTLICQPNILP